MAVFQILIDSWLAFFLPLQIFSKWHIFSYFYHSSHITVSGLNHRVWLLTNTSALFDQLVHMKLLTFRSSCVLGELVNVDIECSECAFTMAEEEFTADVQCCRLPILLVTTRLWAWANHVWPNQPFMWLLRGSLCFKLFLAYLK